MKLIRITEKKGIYIYIYYYYLKYEIDVIFIKNMDYNIKISYTFLK